MPDIAQLNLVINSVQLAQANSRLDVFVHQAGKAEQAVNKLAGTSATGFGSMTALLFKLTAALGAAGLAWSAFQQAIQFEQLQVGFKTLLGDMEKANKMLDDLSKFAAATPFEFLPLAGTAKQLMVMGVEAEKIIPTLKSIGDAAGQMGIGTEGIQRIIINLGQMKSQAKITGDEMRDLAIIGIPAWKILSEVSGKSTKELMAQAKKGALDVDYTIDALMYGMGQKFRGGMESMSQTVGGLMSTLKDEFNLVLREIGLTVIEVIGFKDRLKELIEVVKLGGAVTVDFVRGLAGAEAPKWMSNKGVFEAGQATATFFRDLWRDVGRGWYELLGAFQVGWELFRYGAVAAIDAARAGLGQLLEIAAKLADAMDPEAKVSAALGKAHPLLGAAADWAMGDRIGDEMRRMSAGLKVPMGDKSLDEVLAKVHEIRTATDQLKDASAKSNFMDDAQWMINSVTGGLYGKWQEGQLALQKEMNAQKTTFPDMQKPEGSIYGDRTGKMSVAAEKSYKRLQQEMADAMDSSLALVEIGRDVGKAFGDAFEEAALSGKEFGEVMEGLAIDIERILLKRLVTDQISAALGLAITGIGGAVGGAIGGAFAGGAAPAMSAGDAAWMAELQGTPNPGYTPPAGVPNPPNTPLPGNTNWSGFASGAVIDTPTIAHVGEYGNEVVMPIVRGAGGRMGVASSGGGGSQTFNFNYHGPDAAGFRRSTKQMAADARRMMRT